MEIFSPREISKRIEDKMTRLNIFTDEAEIEYKTGKKETIKRDIYDLIEVVLDLRYIRYMQSNKTIIIPFESVEKIQLGRIL